MIKIELHADDLGRSKAINETIFKSIDDGIVRGVSVILGNKDTEEGIKGALKRNIRISLHLNLTEGPCLSQNMSQNIVDEKKNFNKNFLFLLLCRYKKNFKDIKSEVKNEIEKQIIEFKNISNLQSVSIDGHNHIHCIPWIADIIINIAKKYNIVWVRLPYEKFFFPNIKNFFVKWYYINLLKFFILRILSINLRNKLVNSNIKFFPNFIGILETGHMKFSSIKKGLKKICQNINKIEKNHVEVLIHPGASNIDEKKLWNNEKEHFYYLDENRTNELNLSKNKNLINLINSYENFDHN